MRRYHLSKKRIKVLKNRLSFDFWIGDIEKSVKLEIVENEHVVILANDEPSYFLYNGFYYPTVYLLLKYPSDRNYVTVDMGAVKHVLNGANVFSPGIVDCDKNIKTGDCIYIRDEKYKKAIAIGIAEMNCEEMLKRKSGIAVKNIHYYGDKIYKI